MSESDCLAARFEAHRSHLRAVAYRMLGSSAEADDAVQEAWLRLSRTDADAVENLGGWLTTVVSRVCLTMLQARRNRREQPLDDRPGGERPAGDQPAPGDALDPEDEALLADSVGAALQVVLDTLGPAERLAFVLHDLFAVPFDDIAPIVGRSPAAARQLASRARRRVQGAAAGAAAGAGRRHVVSAFLAASRDGNFDALLALLDPGVVLRADATAVQTGAEAEVRGAREVAATFAGRARAARAALIDGLPGLVWSQGGAPRVVFGFTIAGDTIVAIDLLADPHVLSGLELEYLSG